MNNERKYLTVAEVGERFGVSTDFVYGAIRDGQLRAVRLGRLVRIPIEAVDAWASMPAGQR